MTDKTVKSHYWTLYLENRILKIQKTMKRHPRFMLSNEKCPQRRSHLGEVPAEAATSQGNVCISSQISKVT